MHEFVSVVVHELFLPMLLFISLFCCCSLVYVVVHQLVLLLFINLFCCFACVLFCQCCYLLVCFVAVH